MSAKKDDGIVLKMCLEEVKSIQKKENERTIDILRNFLPKVIPIREEYKKLEESQAKHFNIFSILRKEHDEVYLHSRFIYELLNPKSKIHQQKEKFLKEFLSILKDGKELANFFSDDELSTISVERERDNIDILISSKDKAVIIENKIHEGYRDNQLSGYKDKVKNLGYKEENIKTVYLTLDGDEVPEENESDETVREETVLLSYKKHIVRWLEACIEKVASIQRMRETLQQYLELIKKLTGQALDKEETMKIKELFLANKDYMKAFADAQEGFEATQEELKEKFREELIKRFENKYKNIEYIFDDRHYVSVPVCEIEGKDTISFFFAIFYDMPKYVSWYEYGFILYKKDTRGESSTEELQKTITKHMEKVLGKCKVISRRNEEPRNRGIWPWWKSIEESLTDFTKDEVCTLHFDKKARNKFIDEKFQEAKKLIKKLKQSEEFKQYTWLI